MFLFANAKLKLPCVSFCKCEVKVALFLFSIAKLKLPCVSFCKCEVKVALFLFANAKLKLPCVSFCKCEIKVALFLFAKRKKATLISLWSRWSGSFLANNLRFLVKVFDKAIVINGKIHQNERKMFYSSNKRRFTLLRQKNHSKLIHLNIFQVKIKSQI